MARTLPGEAHPDSDVDLLVDYDKNNVFTLFTIGSIISKLSATLGRQVDIVENGRALPFAIDSVNKTKILIYERKY